MTINPAPRDATDGTAPSDPGSRHAKLPVYRRGVTGVPGEVVLLTPRLPDSAPSTPTRRVPAGERLDLLAARTLGDPHRYWRVADANPTASVAELEVPGRDLAIPEGS